MYIHLYICIYECIVVYDSICISIHAFFRLLVIRSGVPFLSPLMQGPLASHIACCLALCRFGLASDTPSNPTVRLMAGWVIVVRYPCHDLSLRARSAATIAQSFPHTFAFVCAHFLWPPPVTILIYKCNKLLPNEAQPPQTTNTKRCSTPYMPYIGAYVYIHIYIVHIYIYTYMIIYVYGIYIDI